MMWHGFMFGNNWQPDTYDFKQNVEKEAGDQLVRLRNRPSTVLLCGNKETEEATNWRSRNKLDDLTRFHIWGYYLTTFHGILARVVARLEPEIQSWFSEFGQGYKWRFCSLSA